MSSLLGGRGFGPTGAAQGLKGTGYKQVSIPQFTDAQMDLFKQLFGQVSPDSFTSRLAGGDQSAFGELEAPALKQFGELQGSIANRFSGMGTGARNSSGFQNAQNTAAQDFASQLQSQRLGLRNQAMRDLMSMSHELLGQRPYENGFVHQQQKPSFWNQLIGGLSTGVGTAAGAYFGGPIGAQIGGSFGSSLSKGFGG